MLATVVPPVQGIEDIFSFSAFVFFPCTDCTSAIPQHHLPLWSFHKPNRSRHPGHPSVWAKGARQLVSRGAEFLTHLLPLLAVPEEVISSTVETFPSELLLLLLVLLLWAPLALALAFL